MRSDTAFSGKKSFRAEEGKGGGEPRGASVLNLEKRRKKKGGPTCQPRAAAYDEEKSLTNVVRPGKRESRVPPSNRTEERRRKKKEPLEKKKKGESFLFIVQSKMKEKKGKGGIQPPGPSSSNLRPEGERSREESRNREERGEPRVAEVSVLHTPPFPRKKEETRVSPPRKLPLHRQRI